MKKRLNILWTTNNKETAHLMVFMYAINSLTNHWWDEVKIIIWGSSAKLVAEDTTIQYKIELAKNQGVELSACIACATQYGVVNKLKELGIEVIPWGEPLTELLKADEYILSV